MGEPRKGKAWLIRKAMENSRTSRTSVAPFDSKQASIIGPDTDPVSVVEESRLLEAEAELLAVKIERDTAHDALRQARTALEPFSDAYERGVAGDNIWPADQSHYRRAYHTYRARGVLEKGDGA